VTSRFEIGQYELISLQSVFEFLKVSMMQTLWLSVNCQIICFTFAVSDSAGRSSGAVASTSPSTHYMSSPSSDEASSSNAAASAAAIRQKLTA
jgi:hypothetical protein